MEGSGEGGGNALGPQSFAGIFGTNSGFRVEWRPAGDVQYLVLKDFWLELKKFSFRREDCSLLYISSKFCDFTDFS